jgi:RimJ/RimL family protein N-acetyltransferase
MRSDPAIETARLLLRLPRKSDFERYVELHANAAAMRHLGGVLSRAAAWRKFLQMPGAWAVQGFAMFSVIDKADGRWLGQTGPWRPEGWPGNEIGWAFHPDAWGKGYATEATTAAIDWAFANLDWSEIIHCIDSANTPSQALARRLGSRSLRRTRLPSPYEAIEVDVWGQSRAKWFAREHPSFPHAPVPARSTRE